MTREPMNLRAVQRARSSAVLTHPGGLHARPAIKLTKLAKRFACAVWISLDDHGPWTDAKSIARVMALKTPQMTTLHFMGEGRDADEAVSALAKLVETDFNDHGDGD